jgi:hypothetical protein
MLVSLGLIDLKFKYLRIQTKNVSNNKNQCQRMWLINPLCDNIKKLMTTSMAIGRQKDFSAQSVKKIFN